MTGKKKSDNSKINKQDKDKVLTESKEETLFKFPCSFPIKIMCDPGKGIEEFVKETVEKEVDDKNKIEFKTRESRTGKFISVTVIFEASSKAQLDRIYEAISKKKHVHMVL